MEKRVLKRRDCDEKSPPTPLPTPPYPSYDFYFVSGTAEHFRDQLYGGPSENKIVLKRDSEHLPDD
jgi:hypothetical protein